ncbi:MAG TPA: DUF58 domain-containing protein [Candidatus Elarobacter sp.]|nr:DUF58 domain-containing protein [Candidatus Elarobacter sp.]HEV2740444.1 DUF58 domain-containing protein [Candidatus Elarobacter sp.]
MPRRRPDLPRIAPRGILALVGLAVVAYVLARTFPWPVAVAVALGAFAALIAYDVALLRGEVEIVRVVPPRLALARRDVLRYEIANRTPAQRRVAIVEAPADRLAIDIGEARATLPARTRATVMIAIVPRERGRTALRSYHARILSRLGIVELRRTFRVPVALRVMPDLSALDRSGDLVARTKLIEAGLRRLRRRGVGGEFASLRDYTTDDPFRSIDWKASARRGKPMVAQYEVERAQQIVVAIDAGRLMSARLGDRRKLDYAVSAALAIAAIARLAADRVGVVAFAANVLARVAPGSGAQHSAQLTDVLSDLEPRFEEADYERAFLEVERTLRRRSLVVLFTDLFDPIASSAVLGAAKLLTTRHLVLVVLMNDAAIAGALRRTPADAGDAYRAAVAATLSDERAHAVATLRNRGMLVVDVPAAELTVALLDAYVDVKTRGLL